jgi:hypothetical protein
LVISSCHPGCKTASRLSLTLPARRHRPRPVSRAAGCEIGRETESELAAELAKLSPERQAKVIAAVKETLRRERLHYVAK